MTNIPLKLPRLRHLLAGVFCTLIALGHSPAMAGWKEANAALQAGNLSQAMSHILPLAEAGDAEAQYMMGYLLSGATGVDHNLSEAFKWYTIAYAQGQTNAAAARAMIGKKLGPFKAAEAQRQAKMWLQKHAMAQAREKGAGSGDTAAGDESDSTAPTPKSKPKKP